MMAAEALLKAKHFIERYYSAQTRYDGSAEARGMKPDLRLGLQGIPVGSEPLCQPKVNGCDGQFLRPHSATLGVVADDKCGDLTFSQTGVKTGKTGSSALNFVYQCFELINIFEASVHTCKAHIGHFVEFFELSHDQLPQAG